MSTSLQVADGTRLAYLTQTTLSVDDANRIIERLRARFPDIVSPPKDDICYATQNRQEAVRILSRQADAIVVLGSQNSSNSQRLAELAAEDGKQAFLVDGPQDLNIDDFAAARYRVDHRRRECTRIGRARNDRLAREKV